MSVNVSLSDTPGVSAYFDGQPIQDQVDEEVRREEERQEKELRDLLASELEDFEDDFLSESNSDEDSVNVSQVSANYDRSQREQNADTRNTATIGYTDSQNQVDSSLQTSHNTPFGKQMFGSSTDDDWMMRIQHASGTAPLPYPHAFHHHNYQFPNSEVSHVTSGHPVPHAHESDKGRMPFISHQDGNVTPQCEMQDQYVQPRNNLVTSSEHSVQISTSTSIAQPLQSVEQGSVPIAINARDQSIQKKVVPEDADIYSGYQVQYNATIKQDNNLEERFYLGDENTDFFFKDGPEEKRTYAQLEILYRARGRELEDITWKLEKQKDEAAKEIRILKHKLAVATGETEGARESLKQCNILLQQSKSDLADASGRIRALETQITSLTEVKDELIKKVQIGESTIENLSHQVQELQDSESLSRARNEHEAVVSSLSQRYEREILSLKEKFDVTSTDLTTKSEEIVFLKKQLSDLSKELEQAQISRGETINRLTKSLEDSQKQCQNLLEHASGHEIATLRVQLQQTVASKKISEDMCSSYQTEIKELKEQLNMFESASSLGAVTTAVGASTHSGPSLDDSMNDLGIKKTLDFGTPHSVSNVEGTSSSDDLISSLRSELERCLRSNKQKRQEVSEKKEELKSLKEEFQAANDRLHEMERTCASQKNRLDEIDSIMASQDNVGIVEAKFKRDIENIKRERALLLEDLEDHKKRLEELGASEARVTEINIELSQQIAQMISDFDADKCAALERSQRTLEEVHKITMDNLRSEIETRFQSEKDMITKSHQNEIDNLKTQLILADQEIDKVKSLYIKTCEERTEGEQELRDKIKKELEIELKELERKQLLAEQELETEREAWINQKNSHEIEINTLECKIAESKTTFENDKEKLLQSLNVQIEKANEEWRIKVEALSETLSEKQKESEKLLKEKELIKEELEKIKVNQLDVKDNSEATAHPADEKKILVDIEVQTSEVINDKVNVNAEGSVKEIDSLKVSIQQQESEMEELKIQHAQEMATVRNEHRRDFENAARKREQKFQTELRFFLKENEEKAKEKLEKALKEQRNRSIEEVEEKVKKLEEEHKLKLQLMKAESKDTQESSCCLKEADLLKLKESFDEEKKSLNMTIADTEKTKKEEIDILIAKHELELVDLQEKFNQEIKKLKLQIEQNKNMKENNPNEDEVLLKDSHASRDDLQKRLEEERAKWFKEAQSYIHGEIENAVKLRKEELQQKFEADSEMQRRQEKELNKEIEVRVQKCLEQKRNEMRDCEEKRDSERELYIEDRVKRKVQTEVESLKTKFLSELNLGVAKEKGRLEQEVKRWKEDVRKKIEEEKETFTRNLVHEMDNKFKNQKQDILQQKEEEIKSIRQEMEEEMCKQLQSERRIAEKEHEKAIVQAGELEQIHDLKERLQSEVDARSKACSERDKAVHFLAQREKSFFEERQKLTAGLKECRRNLNTMKEEHLALEEKCSEMQKRYKEDMREAKRKKENALLQLSSKFNEEKEKLIASFKSHISSMNDEHTKEMEKVRHECEIEKASALLEVRSHAERALTISPMQEPDMEATSLFELRDHYLETVKRIKDDVMNHVQAANTRAASTLKTEMRKQKIKLVKVFKEKCKVSIKSILAGQVSPSCINSIEHSIDVISEALVTSPSATTTKSPISTPRSNNMPQGITLVGYSDIRSEGKTYSKRNGEDNTEGQQQESGDEKSRREKKLIPQPGSTTETVHMQEREKPSRDALHLHGQNHSWSQLAKVDLDSNDSDNRSRGRSNHSSPSSVQRSKSCTSPFSVHDSKAFNVPPLDLSTLEETLPHNQDNLIQKESLHKGEDYRMYGKSCSKELPQREKKESPSVLSDPVRPYKLVDPGKIHGLLSSERSHLTSDDEANASPRERLKMIEARVRLANWVSSGEMPWKSKVDDEDNLGKRFQANCTSSPLFNVSNPAQENLASDSKHYKPSLVIDEMKERENQQFVRPGKEAKDFITSRKKPKRREYRQSSVAMKPRQDTPYKTVDGYSTDDSSDSHTSFVTLEPDPAHSELDDRYSKHVLQREAVIRSEDGQLNSNVDYDRIKAAILNKSLQTPVTGKELRDMGFNSDSGTDSSSSQTFMPLPTSTTAKKHSTQCKRLPNTEYSRNGRADRSRYPEEQVHSTSDGWKTIQKFADSGIESCGHQASTNGTRRKLDVISSSNPKTRGSSQRSKSVERPTRGEGIAGKTSEVSFPLDRSSITWTSDDHYEGGGMWRYRSLEDILASVNVGDIAKEDSSVTRKPGKMSATDAPHRGRSGIPRRIKINDDGRAGHPKGNPVQAMNSDFWAQQSYEDVDDNSCDAGNHLFSLKTLHLQSHYSDHFKKHDDADRKFIEDAVRGRQKHSYLTPAKRNDPPQRPAFSSEPRQATSFRHKSFRGQMTASTDFAQDASYMSLPRSFAAHVNDVRKSLEAIENTPFTQSLSQKKGKMKRSTSEQSLHLLNWDQDSSLAPQFDKYQPAPDIDDLISVYSKGAPTQSQFDLHNFGPDSLF